MSAICTGSTFIHIILASTGSTWAAVTTDKRKSRLTRCALWYTCAVTTSRTVWRTIIECVAIVSSPIVEWVSTFYEHNHATCWGWRSSNKPAFICIPSISCDTRLRSRCTITIKITSLTEQGVIIPLSSVLTRVSTILTWKTIVSSGTSLPVPSWPTIHCNWIWWRNSSLSS